MLFFFFNDTATTEIYTLSLHDALRSRSPAAMRATSRTSGVSRRVIQWPRYKRSARLVVDELPRDSPPARLGIDAGGDRKSTRLNSSHSQISYAVFCLKKKKTEQRPGP